MIRISTVRAIAVVLGMSVLTVLVGSAHGQQTLTIYSHAVHQSVADGSRASGGVNLAAEFEKQANVKLLWVTNPFEQMYDKLLREMNLSASQVDVAFVIDNWASPEVLDRFEALETYQGRAPVEDMPDISQGMLEIFKLKGSQRAMPYRYVAEVLHYNKALFAQRGVAVPTTFEEFVAAAKAITHKRADGAQVYAVTFDQSSNLYTTIYAFGGRVVTPDFQVKVNAPETVRAMTLLRELYQAGAIPPNMTEIDSANQHNLYTQGLLAMEVAPSNYVTTYNDPAKSSIAPNSSVIPLPAAKDNTAIPFPSIASVWAVGITKNGKAENKDKAWEFVRFFSSKRAQLQLGLNGNTPVRISALGNAQYQAKAPDAAALAKVLPYATTRIPAFSGSAEVQRLFLEQAQAAILGQKAPQQAMDDAAAAITRVLKREGHL